MEIVRQSTPLFACHKNLGNEGFNDGFLHQKSEDRIHFFLFNLDMVYLFQLTDFTLRKINFSILKSSAAGEIDAASSRPANPLPIGLCDESEEGAQKKHPE
jgi:hypothetical protein